MEFCVIDEYFVGFVFPVSTLTHTYTYAHTLPCIYTNRGRYTYNSLCNAPTTKIRTMNNNNTNKNNKKKDENDD